MGESEEPVHLRRSVAVSEDISKTKQTCCVHCCMVDSPPSPFANWDFKDKSYSNFRLPCETSKAKMH